MKRKTLLVTLSFFLAVIARAQEVSKPDIVKFKIKSITTIDSEGKPKYTQFYNDKGDFIKQGSLNSSGQLQIDKELFYNDSAQLIEERVYTSNGNIGSSTKFFYNYKNQLIKKTNNAGKPFHTTWEYLYSDKGNKIEEKTTSGNLSTVTTFIYDNKNLLVQEDTWNSSIGKEQRVTYKYNHQGKITEVKLNAFYFKTTITYTHTYDDAGRLIRLVERSSNGVSSTITYAYNEQGLMVSETWKSSLSKTPGKTTYQISFE